jgi:hypothetical protein
LRSRCTSPFALDVDLLHAEVADRDDVRVTQSGERFGFALEARAEGRMQAFEQDLDRDGAAEVELGRSVHRAHAARAEPRVEPVPAIERAPDPRVRVL